MIVIADSGSTKTLWKSIDSSLEAKSPGVNPFILSVEKIVKLLLDSALSSWPRYQVRQLYFYGSGCATKEKKQLVKSALQQLFEGADIVVENDLLGAARALYGNASGMVGILGTGSNACLYDGKEIDRRILSKGYILGDEGGGVHLGKLWLKQYLSDRVPNHLMLAFDEQFALTKEEIIHRIYKQNRPNAFIASVVPFLYAQRKDAFVQEVVRRNFEDYFKEMLTLLPNYSRHPLKTIGSVGYYFKEELVAVARDWEVEVLSADKDPMGGLLHFHAENTLASFVEEGTIKD